MLNPLNNPKIRPDHLDRQVFIYVRQSTLVQVRDNTGSKARQYDLVQRALNLGWPRERITVIDQDQGHSGASIVGRDGFQFLISEVGVGRAGRSSQPGSLPPGPLVQRLVSLDRDLCLERYLGGGRRRRLRSQPIQRSLALGFQGHHERS